MLKVILAVLFLGVIGAFFIFNQNSGKSRDSSPTKLVQNDKEESSQDEPPLKLKSIGVNFEDFKFTKNKLQFNRLFMGFGFVIPASPHIHAGSASLTS